MGKERVNSILLTKGFVPEPTISPLLRPVFFPLFSPGDRVDRSLPALEFNVGVWHAIGSLVLQHNITPSLLGLVPRWGTADAEIKLSVWSKALSKSFEGGRGGGELQPGLVRIALHTQPAAENCVFFISTFPKNSTAFFSQSS